MKQSRRHICLLFPGIKIKIASFKQSWSELTIKAGNIVTVTLYIDSCGCEELCKLLLQFHLQ